MPCRSLSAVNSALGDSVRAWVIRHQLVYRPYGASGPSPDSASRLVEMASDRKLSKCAVAHLRSFRDVMPVGVAATDSTSVRSYWLGTYVVRNQSGSGWADLAIRHRIPPGRTGRARARHRGGRRYRVTFAGGQGSAQVTRRHTAYSGPEYPRARAQPRCLRCSEIRIPASAGNGRPARTRATVNTRD